MRIDPKIESLVRKAMNASVRSNPDEFEAALAPFEHLDTAAEALRLTTGIAIWLLHREFEGEPNEVDLDEVADEVHRSESWSELTRAEIREALQVMTTGAPPSGVEPKAIFIAALVLGAYLLAAGIKAPKQWYEYLDDVEAVLERP